MSVKIKQKMLMETIVLILRFAIQLVSYMRFLALEVWMSMAAKSQTFVYQEERIIMVNFALFLAQENVPIRSSCALGVLTPMVVKSLTHV